jgi:hypothetical protein
VTDLLQQGLGWLEEQRKAHLSRTVTYRRGSSSAKVLATVGATRFESDNGSGMVVEMESRDYLIASADLVLDGQRVLPERGDQVLETCDGATHIYEVMDLGSEKHFVTCDPDGRTLRIHTKFTGTEEAS